MGLMDKFADPELFETLSFGDKMLGSTVTMLMGMGITFVVLMLLWGFVALMGRFMGQGSKKKDSAPAESAPPAPAAAAPVAPAASPASPAADDQVIAAVIAAAVAAYQGSGGTGNLVVRRISRVSGETTFWTNAGRKECIDSRKF